VLQYFLISTGLWDSVIFAELQKNSIECDNLHLKHCGSDI